MRRRRWRRCSRDKIPRGSSVALPELTVRPPRPRCATDWPLPRPSRLPPITIGSHARATARRQAASQFAWQLFLQHSRQLPCPKPAGPQDVRCRDVHEKPETWRSPAISGLQATDHELRSIAHHSAHPAIYRDPTLIVLGKRCTSICQRALLAQCNTELLTLKSLFRAVRMKPYGPMHGYVHLLRPLR
jgi:hypothetical protein